MSNPRSLGSITRNFLQFNGLTKNLPEQRTDQDPLPQFVHPILTQEDFKKTLSLYNRYIDQYNMKVFIENKEIRKYNREVMRHRREASIPKRQRILEELWKEEHKHLSPEAFNQAVEEYNQENGPQLRKKDLRQPVKPATEKFFLAFLHQYNMQLFKRKSLRAGLDVHVPGSLPKLELYPNKVVDTKKDGVRNLPVSVETVRHHRERLEEAGVLTGYSYHGPNRPVKIAFNPEILSITDNGIPKSAGTEDQSLSHSQTKKVRHNNVSSSLQCLEESKSSEEGVVAFAPTDNNCTRTSTRTPRKQGGKNSDVAPKNSPGPQKKFTEALDQNELSAILTSCLEDKTDLAKDLAAGKHQKYTPIAAKIAQQEAYYGAMHPDDFKELAIQDIFKFSGSLFAGMNVHPGSWVNAYKIWLQDQFTNFNGQLLSKPNLFARWMKCIETLRQAKRFQAKHQDYQPTFPSRYFDTARTGKEHNSFAYAFRNFKLEEEKVEKFEKRKIQAEKSTRTKTDLEKARTKIRQYMNGKCDLQDVYSYVQHTCNREVNQNLNSIFKKEFEKYQA